jgi:hypothetical protein
MGVRKYSLGRERGVSPSATRRIIHFLQELTYANKEGNIIKLIACMAEQCIIGE